MESEILRLMQVVCDGKGTRKESGGRVVGIICKLLGLKCVIIGNNGNNR